MKVLNRLLPAWYLPRGTIKAASEEKLEAASTSCERWGFWSAALVIVGVIAEVVIAWIEPPYLTFLRESFITDAAVGIGITGEVLLGTMWNGKIQTELRKRYTEKLADAIERAAKLEKEAAEARERVADLEQITAWRKISAEEKRRMIEILKHSPSALRVFIEYQNGDMEALTHAIEISKIFDAAGVTITGSQSNLWTREEPAYGLCISVSPDIECSAVWDAFNIPETSAVFSKEWEPLKMWPIPPAKPRPNVLVAVYPKPPPISILESFIAEDARNP